MVAPAVPASWGDHRVGVGGVFEWLNEMSTAEKIWTLIGFGGQALFASRFIIQWFRSEQVGRSIIPIEFCYCSIGGGIILFSYALYRQDPVFIAGQGLGLFVYARNLFLIFREKKGLAGEETKTPDLSLGPQSAGEIIAQQSTLAAAARQSRTVSTLAKSFEKTEPQGPIAAAPAPEKA